LTSHPTLHTQHDTPYTLQTERDKERDKEREIERQTETQRQSVGGGQNVVLLAAMGKEADKDR
jgi:hypothetical protein